MTAAQVQAALGRALVGAACVLMSTEVPIAAVAAAVRATVAAGVPCIVNPAPVVPGLADLVALGAMLTPNETELVELAGALGLDAQSGDRGELLVALVRASGAPAVVTLGGEGCLYLAPAGAPQAVRAGPVEVADTTGAGDTFNGVLAARLAAGDDLSTAVNTAVLAASLSVGAVGARAGMPDATAIAAARRRG